MGSTDAHGAREKVRVFLRGISSASYGLAEHRRRVLAGQRVRGPKVVVDDGSVAHESQSADTRTWWRLSPGDEEFLTQSLQVHFLDLPAQSANTCHGHQNEALFYVLSGRGYEVHDDQRYDWQAGDLVCVHADSVHQHFNPYDEPAQLMVIKAKSLWMFLGLLQQGRPGARSDWTGFGPRQDWAPLWQPGQGELAKVVRPTEQDWVAGPGGRHRALTGPARPDVRNHSVVLEEHQLAPGARSPREWGMADEVLYVLAGRGAARHWQVEADLDERYHARVALVPSEHQLAAGDLLYVPTNTVTETVNTDPDAPLVLLRARNRAFDSLGYRGRFPVTDLALPEQERHDHAG